MWHVPLALGLFVVSMFLLYQGVAFLRWVTKNEEDAPNPRAGTRIAWALTGVIILFFWLQPLIGTPFLEHAFNQSEPFAFLVGGFSFFLLGKPEAFSQALLIASIPVGMLAAFKFVMAAALARSSEAPPSALSRSPMAVLAGAICVVIQLAGSIASLYTVLH